MLPINSFCFLLLICSTLGGQEWLQKIFFFDGRLNQYSEREFWFNLPSSPSLQAPKAKKQVLMVLWHGLGNSCDDFKDKTNMVSYSEEYGFYLITPCGLRGILNRYSFSAGGCCGGAKSPDDYEFYNQMILWTDGFIAERGFPPYEEVWLMGYSNGGFMSEGLSCSHRDKVTKTVSIAGATILERGGNNGLNVCDSRYFASGIAIGPSPPKVSILNIHGTKDPVVPMAGGGFLMRFPNIMTNMERWAARNGCSADYESTWLDGDREMRSFCPGGGGGDVKLLLHHDWGHGFASWFPQAAMQFFMDKL